MEKQHPWSIAEGCADRGVYYDETTVNTVPSAIDRAFSVVSTGMFLMDRRRVIEGLSSVK